MVVVSPAHFPGKVLLRNLKDAAFPVFVNGTAVEVSTGGERSRSCKDSARAR
jgi:hypothetical protein